MEVIAEIESQGFKFYQLKDKDGKEYTAEKIFVSRKPRPQIMFNLIKKLNERIAAEKILHPSFINYTAIEQIEGEYYLISNKRSSLKPLCVYLKEKKLSLEEVVDWLVTIGEVAEEGEKINFFLSGLNLESLWMDDKGDIHMTDPFIVSLLAKYRGDLPNSFLTELYQPPELFQNNSWDERSRLYSLGIISYYLLTEKLPFTAGNKADLIDEILNTKVLEPCYYNSFISQDLSNLIINLLSKERAERLESWTAFLEKLKKIKETGRFRASNDEKEKNRLRSKKLIRTKEKKQGVRHFFRRRWKTLTVSLAALIVFILIFFMGGSEPIVTENTTPEQVVTYFYKAVDEKDVLLLSDTTIVDLKHLERMISETHVIEKMRSAYPTDYKEDNDKGLESLFGINELSIIQVEDEIQPVFKASYLFYINEPEQRQEFSMEDIVRLENVEGRWQIVEFAGSILSIINGNMEQLSAAK